MCVRICGRCLPPATTSVCLPAEANENMKELGRRLLRQENLPKFEPVDLKLSMLLTEGGWVGRVGGCPAHVRLRSCARWISRRLLLLPLPDAAPHPAAPPVCLCGCLPGRRLQEEQDRVNETRLSGEYLKPSVRGGRSLLGLQG